jgi:cyclophilin family peptidyl-prolyl cis-trans isomerase
MAVAAVPTASGQAITREAVLRAEDARARAPGELELLVAATRIADLRLIAIRALGRLERPEFADTILPFLEDTAVVAVAAEALAQSLRGMPPAGERSSGDGALLDRVRSALVRHARPYAPPAARGAVARSLARLPHSGPEEVRAVEAVLVQVITPSRIQWQELPLVEDVAAALYTIARGRRSLGEPSGAAVEWLRQAAVVRRVDPIGPPRIAPVRRLAWLALNAARVVDTAMIRAAIADSDAQVRRLAIQALPDVADSGFRRWVLDRARRDADGIVRLEWIAGHRLLSPGECAPVLQATTDTNLHVSLAAIGALSGDCTERESVRQRLMELVAAGPRDAVPRKRGAFSWHGLAHALVAMVRVAPDTARHLIRAHAGHPVWQVRMYAARGAVILQDTPVLNRLAFDSVGSVREVAIAGLSSTVGHVADLIYARALSSPDHHVVLAAARALRGAPVRDSVLPAIVAAFERLSEVGEQTSRDPRLALLARIDEMATASVVPVLAARGTDVDEHVAREALRIARRLDPQQALVARSSPSPERVALLSGIVKLRMTMAASSGGGSFEVYLNTAEAPITVSRVVALARDGYYDGLTFHRVVPNFVLQGGSPAMNEYVGTGPFMRDELGLAHHARGTVGISTRGRDTGDAQWFINIVDNYRLDHDYTVFGLVMPADLPVVDRILEGDVIESVRIVP